MFKDTDVVNEYAQKALRVLVVEDDEVNLLVISRLLEKKGYVVETAVNGQKALSILGNEIFDIVLMDISMPKIDGLALTRKMKRNSHTQNIPVVAMTTYASEKDRENLLAEGLDGYITKPVDPVELHKIIMQLTSAYSEVIDQNGLILRTGGDRDFMRDIAEVFCHTSAQAVDEIKKSSDLQVIAGLAHKLKGSAETVGARTVVDMALRIKHAAEQGDIEDSHEACANFDKSLSLFKQGLANLGIILHGTEK
ncbi:MAG: response regulator [Syntrophomonas sp.]|nr:response regulator [Syntrophomonas sp.]